MATRRSRKASGSGNRYAVGSKLSEKTFEEVLRNYIDRIPATQAAEMIPNDKGEFGTVNEKTVRSLYDKFRKRLLEDTRLSAWMNGGVNNLPPAEDEVWDKIYFCTLKCPVHTEKLETVPGEIEYDTVTKSPYLKKRLKCKPCPIRLKKALGLTALQAIRYRSSTMKGIPKSKFREYFFETMFYINSSNQNKKFQIPYSKQEFLAHYLHILEIDPLV